MFSGVLKRSFRNKENLIKTIPILTSYYVTKDEVYDCLNNDVTITIFSKKYLEMLLSLKFKDNLNVQILIDNGSNILGIK